MPTLGTSGGVTEVVVEEVVVVVVEEEVVVVVEEVVVLDDVVVVVVVELEELCSLTVEELVSGSETTGVLTSGTVAVLVTTGGAVDTGSCAVL